MIMPARLLNVDMIKYLSMCFKPLLRNISVFTFNFSALWYMYDKVTAHKKMTCVIIKLRSVIKTWWQITLSARRLLLISAPSILVFLSELDVSAPLSLPLWNKSEPINDYWIFVMYSNSIFLYIAKKTVQEYLTV